MFALKGTFWLVGLAVSLPVTAQTTAPSEYSIHEAIAPAAGGSSRMIYRSGTKALIDVAGTSRSDSQPGNHTRILYDLQAHTSYSWSFNASSDQASQCSSGTFSGDWGDPFAMTSDLSKAIVRGDFKQVATEPVGGVTTKVYDGTTGGRHVKAWLDAQTGLVMRAQIGLSNGRLQTLTEILNASFAPPPASIFVLPAACAEAKADPQ